MGALLQDRIALWLSSHPGATAYQIARGVRAGDSKVREVLAGPLFRSATEGKRVTYSLALDGADEVRRVRRTLRRTHKQRVLDLLSDGEPHSHMEGYRLNVMLHSRVADLRRDGYRVDCWRDGDLYWYRLLNEPGEAAPPGSLSGRAGPPGGVSGDCADLSAAQLTLPVAGRGAYSSSGSGV